MSETSVGIEGLREFQRALRTLDKTKAKGLRLAMNESADLLISRTRRKIPKRSGAAAASLKPRSTQTSVRIAIGGRKAPYYPWLDFGGRVGPGKSVTRPFLKEGRYLYPTFSSSRADFARILEDSLTDLARDAGLDV